MPKNVTVAGECVDTCPVDINKLKNKKSVLIHANGCFGCEKCIAACKQGALPVTEI
ncbi:MAG: ferredoxin [Desulfobacteraceae bacterium]|nr:MAG: ferredoxin [Desulfobacteraceae bacterium]